MKYLMIIVAAAISFAASPVSAQGLRGDWKIESGQYAGDSIVATALSSMSLKFTGDKFEAKSGDSVSSGKVTQNARARPAQLVFKIETGADAGREIKAIYQQTNNKMKIAFSQDSSFPLNFASSTSNKLLVLDYQTTGQSVAGNTGVPKRTRPKLNAAFGSSSGTGGK